MEDMPLKDRPEQLDGTLTSLFPRGNEMATGWQRVLGLTSPNCPSALAPMEWKDRQLVGLNTCWSQGLWGTASPGGLYPALLAPSLFSAHHPL